MLNLCAQALHGPLPSFYWPEQDDICTIPYNQIICAFDPPSTTPCGQKQLNKILTSKSN